jgi:hypothetical protein
MSPWTNEDYKNNFIIGTHGSGRSRLSEIAEIKCKKENGLFLDFGNNPKMLGLKPYEYYMAKNLRDTLLRGFLKKYRNRKIVMVSKTHTDDLYENEIQHKNKTKVKTKSANLYRYLLSEAREALLSQTGVSLNENQIIALLEPHNLDEALEDYGDVDTVLRETFADALCMKLLGKSWPNYNDINEGGGLLNCVCKNDLPFSKELNAAALENGYKVKF